MEKIEPYKRGKRGLSGKKKGVLWRERKYLREEREAFEGENGAIFGKKGRHMRREMEASEGGK